MTLTAKDQETRWQAVCEASQIVPDTGVCALIEGRQVAIFYSKRLDTHFAVDNYDPIGRASVLSRGMIGSIGERICVASPLYKQHFDLRTGECVEEPSVAINVYPLKLENDMIKVQVPHL